MIEQLMLRRNIKINFPIRFGYRTVYVIFTTFIAITLVRGYTTAALHSAAAALAHAAALGSIHSSQGALFRHAL